jgi:hypothetical protein
VYTTFAPDNNSIGVKPVDGNHCTSYLNSDHAGTPENYKPYVIGGARGGGGSNWTGGLTGTQTVAPCGQEGANADDRGIGFGKGKLERLRRAILEQIQQ